MTFVVGCFSVARDMCGVGVGRDNYNRSIVVLKKSVKRGYLWKKTAAAGLETRTSQKLMMLFSLI